MAFVKQKTFEFDDALADHFERFCAERMLVEKRVAAATIAHFLASDPMQRDAILLAYVGWLKKMADYEPPKEKDDLQPLRRYKKARKPTVTKMPRTGAKGRDAEDRAK